VFIESVKATKKLVQNIANVNLDILMDFYLDEGKKCVEYPLVDFLFLNQLVFCLLKIYTLITKTRKKNKFWFFWNQKFSLFEKMSFFQEQIMIFS
jgi:hypothetical protein